MLARAPRAPLSGAIRPGLIEARSAAGSSPALIPGYPGQFAPASLKRRVADRRQEALRRLSGAIRPGLIEAAGCRRGPSTPASVIRGNSPRPH